MRKNLAQVLQDAKVDIKQEYKRLHRLFYESDPSRYQLSSLYDEINASFDLVWFRGTSLNLDDFDKEYGYHFKTVPKNLDLTCLVSFCEYSYNLIMCFPNMSSFYLQQIHTVIERIGYTEVYNGTITVFVEKDPAAISVSASKLLPAAISYKVLSYNHHSLKGKIEDKKDILLKLIDLLEPRKKELAGIDSNFKRDLFNAFNNLNLRHNNTTPGSDCYHKYVADMENAELEKWYDEIYQMCLLAFLRLEHAERKPKFDELMKKVNERGNV